MLKTNPNYFVIQDNTILYKSNLFIDSWLFAKDLKGSSTIIGSDGEWKIEGFFSINSIRTDSLN